MGGYTPLQKRHLIWRYPSGVHPPLASDRCSFGVVLWELWTGLEPYADLNYHALMMRLAADRATGEQLRPPLPGSPEWDGEPVEPTPVDPKVPATTIESPNPEPKEPRERREKLVIKLADGKEREFQSMTSKMFYSVDGTPLSLREFIESLFNTLDMPEFFKDEEELRERWSVPSTRKALLQLLEDAGFPVTDLEVIQELIEAESSDLFDVLEYVKYSLKPITRKARAALSRSLLEAELEAKQLEFVDFLISQYVESGVGELDDTKLNTLLEIKYVDVFSAIKVLGNGETSRVRNLFLEFQKKLYLPHAEYGVSA